MPFTEPFRPVINQVGVTAGSREGGVVACTLKRAGRWYIRYLDPSGVDVRKRVNARTKREADLILAQVLQEIDNNDYEVLKRQR